MLRQHRQTVFAHFGKAATHLDFLRLAAFGAIDLDGAVANGGHERRVAFQHAEFAFRAGDDHHVDILRTDEPGRGYEFEVEGHDFQASSASFLALATASSIPPTM